MGVHQNGGGSVYLFARIMKSGVDEGPIVKALAYLLLLTVRDHDSDRVLETFAIALRTESNEPMSQEAIAFLIMPILDSLQTDLQLVCTSDCSRFFRDDSVKYWEGRDPLDSYWCGSGHAASRRKPARAPITASNEQPNRAV